MAGADMGAVKQQFFPASDRPELLVKVRMLEGTSIGAARAAMVKVPLGCSSPRPIL
jgi:multidrug efflux pump subunit AcrB